MRKSEPSAKPKASPHDLGPYRNLGEWRKKVSSEPLLSSSLEIQKQLAAGYFEFSRPRKAEIYRSARELLAHLWVDLDLLKTSEPTFEPLMWELSEVIANVSGVLRKIERKPDQAPHGERL